MTHNHELFMFHPICFIVFSIYIDLLFSEFFQNKSCPLTSKYYGSYFLRTGHSPIYSSYHYNIRKFNIYACYHLIHSPNSYIVNCLNNILYTNFFPDPKSNPESYSIYISVVIFNWQWSFSLSLSLLTLLSFEEFRSVLVL